MIDVSDGLAADLGHVLVSSGVGADLDLSRLPLSPSVAEEVAGSDDWDLPLASGDDYELCFCLPPDREAALPALSARAGCPVTVIGRIRRGRDLACLAPDGSVVSLARTGFDHFPAPAPTGSSTDPSADPPRTRR
jgi:thiamine-monophosphate kinase